MSWTRTLGIIKFQGDHLGEPKKKKKKWIPGINISILHRISTVFDDTHDTILKESRLFVVIIIHHGQCHLYRQFILWLETRSTQACESHYTRHDHLRQNWANLHLRPTVGTKREAGLYLVYHVWGCECSLKLRPTALLCDLPNSK